MLQTLIRTTCLHNTARQAPTHRLRLTASSPTGILLPSVCPQGVYTIRAPSPRCACHTPHSCTCTKRKTCSSLISSIITQFNQGTYHLKLSVFSHSCLHGLSVRCLHLIALCVVTVAHTPCRCNHTHSHSMHHSFTVTPLQEHMGSHDELKPSVISM